MNNALLEKAKALFQDEENLDANEFPEGIESVLRVAIEACLSEVKAVADNPDIMGIDEEPEITRRISALLT